MQCCLTTPFQRTEVISQNFQTSKAISFLNKQFEKKVNNRVLLSPNKISQVRNIMIMYQWSETSKLQSSKKSILICILDCVESIDSLSLSYIRAVDLS